MTEQDTLRRIYDFAKSDAYVLRLPNDARTSCDTIINYHETRKGVLTVLLTLLLKKVVSPDQDIRFHQVQLPGGFSGRRLDTEIVTPFMKEQRFPSMRESGWLTRSLEQPAPYDLDYPGKISPPELKDAFLNLIDTVERDQMVARHVAESALGHILRELIERRERNLNIPLRRPVQAQSSHVSVREAVDKVVQHYSSRIRGASRLPVLAIHAILTTLTNELSRYENCKVLPLESHTAADSKTESVGDIHVTRSDGSIYEGYEIKHRIAITPLLIQDCYMKFRTISIDRYYILTTYSHDDYSQFDPDIARIAGEHGCQVIVNGVDRTLMYYLRLIRSTSDFVNEYVSNLENDPSISYELKMAWNDIF